MKHSAISGAVIFSLALLAGCEIGVEGQPAAQQAPTSAARGSASSASGQVNRGSLQFIDGYRPGYAAGIQQAKPMLVFFTAEWCHFCHQMADEAFTHPQVVSLSEHFVCILVDADAEADVCRQFGISGYPTIQFLSPRGVPLERIVGKRPGHQVMMAMQAALQNVARRGDAPEEHEETVVR